jgi:hypothetical protein
MQQRGLTNRLRQVFSTSFDDIAGYILITKKAGTWSQARLHNPDAVQLPSGAF